MELRQLKYFAVIAETGGFTEASRRCYLSQSAISQQIKNLEEELNTTLFVRTPHKVMLTESGEMLLPLARKILKSVDDCNVLMNDIHGMLCGELSIGLTASFEPYIRKAVVQFIRKYPKVHLHLYYKTIPELITMLRASELDMAFSIKVRGEEDWVDSVAIAKYRLCAIMRKTHPLADRDILTLKALAAQPLILPEEPLGDKSAIAHILEKSATELSIRATINDSCAILNQLKISNCISILSENSIDGMDELCAIPILEFLDPFTSYVHTLKNAYRKKAVDAFLKEIK